MENTIHLWLEAWRLMTLRREQVGRRWRCWWRTLSTDVTDTAYNVHSITEESVCATFVCGNMKHGPKKTHLQMYTWPLNLGYATIFSGFQTFSVWLIPETATRTKHTHIPTLAHHQESFDKLLGRLHTCDLWSPHCDDTSCFYDTVTCGFWLN